MVAVSSDVLLTSKMMSSNLTILISSIAGPSSSGGKPGQEACSKNTCICLSCLTVFSREWKVRFCRRLLLSAAMSSSIW